MEELVNDLQEGKEKGWMHKAKGFVGAMCGQDEIRDRIQEIEEDLNRLSRAAVMRTHVCNFFIGSG